jgi:hypothetical protein
MRLVYGEYMYSVESGKADKATFFLSREECEKEARNSTLGSDLSSTHLVFFCKPVYRLMWGW